MKMKVATKVVDVICFSFLPDERSVGTIICTLVRAIGINDVEVLFNVRS